MILQNKQWTREVLLSHWMKFIDLETIHVLDSLPVLYIQNYQPRESRRLAVRLHVFYTTNDAV